MPNDLSIRPALVSEQKLLEEIQWRASLNNLGDREAMLAHPDAIELPLDQITAGAVFVAETSGSIKGFAVILPRAAGDIELDGLFVEPDTWRRGICRALVEHCALAAKVTGAEFLYVIGNPHAEDFYSACGFTKFGIQQMRFGIGLLMKKRLS